MPTDAARQLPSPIEPARVDTSSNMVDDRFRTHPILRFWITRSVTAGEELFEIRIRDRSHVIACDKREAFAQGSEATKQSIHPLCREMGCFASLAMTAPPPHPDRRLLVFCVRLPCPACSRILFFSSSRWPLVVSRGTLGALPGPLWLWLSAGIGGTVFVVMVSVING